VLCFVSFFPIQYTTYQSGQSEVDSAPVTISTMAPTGQTLRTMQLLLVVLPAFVLFGYNQSGVGGLLSLRDWNDHFPQIDTIDATGAEKSVKSTRQGAVVATFTIGALFGALACTWVGDVLGRRKVIFGAAILTLVGEVLQCTSFQLAQFIVGRFSTYKFLFLLRYHLLMIEQFLAGESVRFRLLCLSGNLNARLRRTAGNTLCLMGALSVWDTCSKRGLILGSSRFRRRLRCSGVFRLRFRVSSR